MGIYYHCCNTTFVRNNAGLLLNWVAFFAPVAFVVALHRVVNARIDALLQITLPLVPHTHVYTRYKRLMHLFILLPGHQTLGANLFPSIKLG